MRGLRHPKPFRERLAWESVEPGYRRLWRTRYLIATRPGPWALFLALMAPVVYSMLWR
jgi:hypothetical protein